MDQVAECLDAPNDARGTMTDYERAIDDIATWHEAKRRDFLDLAARPNTPEAISAYRRYATLHDDCADHIRNMKAAGCALR